jgi:predicted acyltransferase
MGVLPRIALCYLCAGLFVVAFARRADREDFRPNLIAVTSLMIVLLVGYWALMTFVPVPGYGAGNLSPDGNLAAYLDRSIMLGHLWKPMWDPEGFLSSLPAIATVLSGVLLGEFLRSARSAQKKFLAMLAMGAAAMLLGRLLHPIFPINKNLWTSTFVIFTSGFAMVVLAFCYWLADIRGWRKWGMPFLVFGSNAVASFTLATFLAKCLIVIHVTSDGERTSLWGYIYENLFAPIPSAKNASLLFAICFVLVCWVPMWLLYRRRIFIKV